MKSQKKTPTSTKVVKGTGVSNRGRSLRLPKPQWLWLAGFIIFGGIGSYLLIRSFAATPETYSASSAPVTIASWNTFVDNKTTLKRGSLAISSTTKRRWVHGGKTYHPVIDPLTKRPSANGVVAVYVKGQTGLIADTLATVLLLRPDAKERIEKTFDVKARIVRENQL